MRNLEILDERPKQIGENRVFIINKEILEALLSGKYLSVPFDYWDAEEDGIVIKYQE